MEDEKDQLIKRVERLRKRVRSTVYTGNAVGFRVYFGMKTNLYQFHCETQQAANGL